ncbi:hypothetical protein [Paraburkholderia nemoris]|uniref:hypothetical protein n=1 Tax=Paraburkholderia nemoris TaxID=2793076 RepID=UPI0038B74CB6
MPAELWHGFVCDMSVAEVQAELHCTYAPPCATTVEIPDVGKARELLRAHDVSSMAHNFTAHLYFYREQLKQVTLSGPVSGNKSLEDVFTNRAAMSRSTYGADSRHESNDSPALTVEVLTWTRRSTNIALVMVQTKKQGHIPRRCT